MASPSHTPVSNTAVVPASSRKIEYLSKPADVSMTDGYFELASVDHFWVRRRFEVFRELAGGLVPLARAIADVGCGHGLLQRQIEQAYGREVTGFDLNQNGLAHNVSQLSRVCCYDIFQRDPSFQAHFDLLFLWDVLEHIRDEDAFLQAILYHLAPGGRLIINVPAEEWGYSGYDRAAGHMRRYSHRSLLETLRRNHLHVLSWTYWGFPFLPTLVFRRLWLRGERDQTRAYATGFATGSRFANELYGLLSHLESIPQGWAGTSLMVVCQETVFKT